MMVCAIAFATAVRANDLKQLKSDYDMLQKWQYSTPPVRITQPVTITRDTATWTLSSGTVAFAEPISGGHITGLVWQGEGRFTMTVPDRFEVAQLRRFADKPDMERIDEPITELVLRVSDDQIEKLFTDAAKSATYAPNAAADKRHNHWLIDLGNDVDARVLNAMLNAGGLQMTAGFKTASYDWLTYDYNSSRDEEIQLTKFKSTVAESWLSLDRAEDRDASGRPGARLSRNAALSHIDVKADLTHLGRETVGESGQRTIHAHFIVEEELTARANVVGAMTLELSGWAQDVTAKDEKGNDLLVLRDHIGRRTTNFDRKVHDGTLTLIFPEPLKNGEARNVTFEYELEMPNYAPGDTWYPTVSGALESYTAKLALTVGRRNQIRAMGRLDSTKEDDRGTTSIWIIDKPTKMVTFATAERFQEVPLQVPGVPKVISFGWASGLDVGTRVRNSGADVVNGLQFFQQMLDSPIGGDTFYVTSIVGNHGQAFDGFLHLAEASYDEHPGASELFRTHEVAHEWFGHRVGWKSYRDQWLSEAFAEYAAMFFVKSAVKDGNKYFNEILTVYDYMIKGDMRGMFSKFNRPYLVQWSSAKRARIGPIGIGYRAGTQDMPAAYLVQTYYKGPLVLHMIRELLLFKTNSDDLFIKILRDYVHEFSGKDPSTDDFRRIVERNAPADWSWLFNGWVYSAEIPTVRYSWKAEPAGDKYQLTLKVKRSDVPKDFTFMTPVLVQFDGNKQGSFFITVKDDEQTITTDIPLKPRDVILGPDHSLLANIKKE
jgi:hypothetical protein